MYWAIILNIWRDDPVYHAVNYDTVGTDVERTKCGRPIASYKPWLPHKHAVKFARPCRGCFPS